MKCKETLLDEILCRMNAISTTDWKEFSNEDLIKKFEELNGK